MTACYVSSRQTDTKVALKSLPDTWVNPCAVSQALYLPLSFLLSTSLVSMVGFPSSTLSIHVNTLNFSILPLSLIIDSFHSSASGDVGLLVL
jgi:hypothetical protein